MAIRGKVKVEYLGPTERAQASKVLAKDHRFQISADGNDVLLKFGKHSGKMVSHLAADGDDYLDWMLTDDGFPDHVKSIIRFQITKARIDAAKKAAK